MDISRALAAARPGLLGVGRIAVFRRHRTRAAALGAHAGAEDVFGTPRAGKRRGTGSVAPKYRNPADPEQTWSGRGKRPRWFNDALKAGKKEKDLAI